MLKSVFAVAVVILAVMIAVKDGRILRTAGLTGSCRVAQVFTDSSELATCTPGKLEGRPDLSHRGCRSVGLRGQTEYWRCAQGFDVSDLGR